MRLVRFTRVFRIFKVSRYLKGIALLIETMKASSLGILIVFSMVIYINIFTSIIMYYSEYYAMEDGLVDFEDAYIDSIPSKKLYI